VKKGAQLIVQQVGTLTNIFQSSSEVFGTLSQGVDHPINATAINNIATSHIR
jgi:hypothetical protein